jgi:biopolymer transport protein ExbD
MTLQLASRGAAGRFTLRQNHEMNVTPFVDVLLVLLIVFIIAAPLATTAIDVDIATGHGVTGQIRTPTYVVIDDHGGLALRSAAAGEIPTRLDTLDRDLARLAGARAAVMIVGATHTRYGAFVAVIDRLHAGGFTNVTLAGKL